MGRIIPFLFAKCGSRHRDFTDVIMISGLVGVTSEFKSRQSGSRVSSQAGSRARFAFDVMHSFLFLLDLLWTIFFISLNLWTSLQLIQLIFAMIGSYVVDIYHEHWINKYWTIAPRVERGRTQGRFLLASGHIFIKQSMHNLVLCVFCLKTLEYILNTRIH